MKTNDLSVEKKIEIFFQDPKEKKKNPNIYGTLYLLRRDIYRCMGYDFDASTFKNNEAIIWPGAMTVLAGIDLLGKFYAGSDDFQNRGVGVRFKGFYGKYIDDENAEIIYQLRNSLLHSFGLLSKAGNKITYRFVVGASRDNLVKLLSESVNEIYCQIDLCTLWDKFEGGIIKYKDDLLNSEQLRANFSTMFGDYGSIRIG